jgi:hypothetical protein
MLELLDRADERMYAIKRARHAAPQDCNDPGL